MNIYSERVHWVHDRVEVWPSGEEGRAALARLPIPHAHALKLRVELGERGSRACAQRSGTNRSDRLWIVLNLTVRLEEHHRAACVSECIV